MATWLHARLEFNPCRDDGAVTMAVYQARAHATDEEHFPILTVKLDNAQVREFLMDLKLKPANLDEEAAERYEREHSISKQEPR